VLIFLQDICGCPSFLGHGNFLVGGFILVLLFSDVNPNSPLDIVVDRWKVAEGFPDSDVFYSIIFNSFHVYAQAPSHG